MLIVLPVGGPFLSFQQKFLPYSIEKLTSNSILILPPELTCHVFQILQKQLLLYFVWGSYRSGLSGSPAPRPTFEITDVTIGFFFCQ